MKIIDILKIKYLWYITEPETINLKGPRTIFRAFHNLSNFHLYFHNISSKNNLQCYTSLLTISYITSFVTFDLIEGLSVLA